MKSLNHYTDAPIAEALTRNGAFYAFSNEQFDEQANPNIPRSDYRRGPGGLIIPKDNVDTLIADMQNAVDAGIVQRLLDYPIDDIIAYELGNYECYYSGDIEDALTALAPYNVTREQVLAIFNKTKNDQE